MKSMSVRQDFNLTGLSPSVLNCRPVKNTRQLNIVSVELVRHVIEDRLFYGSRKVAAAIRLQGISMNRKAVQRMGWALPVQKRDRAFAGSERIMLIPTAPDQLWETDITCVGAALTDGATSSTAWTALQGNGWHMCLPGTRGGCMQLTVSSMQLRAVTCPVSF